MGTFKNDICRNFYCFKVTFSIVDFFTADFGDIVRENFDFDVVGHYARPDVLKLTVNDYPLNPVIFSSGAAASEKMDSDNV